MILTFLACTTDATDAGGGAQNHNRDEDSGDATLGPLRLAAVLDQVVAANKGYGGGIVVATAKGEERFRGASGDQVVGGPEIAPESSFEIASITKTVTATTILLLVEQGAFTLDSTLSETLPEYDHGLLVVNGIDQTGSITLRQLLNHTSGLPDYWTDPPFESPGTNAFLKQFQAEPDRFWTPAEILELAAGLNPVGQPGESWHYSDTNYVLLGLVAERAAEETLHDLMRSEIFAPLGMDDTWMSFREDRPLPDAHRYEGHWDMSDKTHQSADWAGGGLVSTADDLTVFIATLSAGSMFADAQTLAAMRTTVPTGYRDISYGLGIFSVQLDDGSNLWGHDGYGNAFAYIHDSDQTVFSGTINQAENDWWEIVEAGL